MQGRVATVGKQGVNIMKQFLLARAKEPSTWAAVSAIGVLFGLPAGTVDGLAQIVGGIAALIGIFTPEGATK
jgi:hypothetical protein